MEENKKKLHQLIQKRIQGEKIEEQLYESYHRLIYQIAFSILKNKENAEDVMQNVFAKLMTIPKEKLPTKYEMSWLYSVTKNEAINEIRKHKKEVCLDEIYEFVDEDTNICEVIEKEDYQKLIRRINKRRTRDCIVKSIVKTKL